MNDEELEGLLNQAKINNAKRDVSGILIYNDSNFIQYLEGPESTLHELFDKIKDDPRYTSVTRLDFAKIDARVFGDWWMGFWRLTGVDISHIKGEHDQRQIMKDILEIESESHMTAIFKHCLKHMIRD